MLYLTPLIDCLDAAVAIKPARVISLLDPGKQFPQCSGVSPYHHLKVEIAGYAWADQPERYSHVRRILEFARLEFAREGFCEPLLVHCHAGASRSGAAVFAILADRYPSRITDISRLIAQRAPHLKPDLHMILAADDILDRRGQLVAAAFLLKPTSPGMTGWIPLSLD